MNLTTTLENSRTKLLPQKLNALVTCDTYGILPYRENMRERIQAAIKKIDILLSKQLSHLLHEDKLQTLEGTWRGLADLCNEVQYGDQLKIKVLHVTKTELSTDFKKSAAYDQSTIFKKVYSKEFDTPGGEPYGILVGNYAFSNTSTDISILTDMSKVSAASFSPFISSISPQFLGLNSWEDISKPHSISKLFDSVDFIEWNAFRKTDESRFCALTLPKVLARLPYGKNGTMVNDFNFEEKTNIENPRDFTWKNSAFCLAEKISLAFISYGWCTAIRGVEGGGKVTQLPLYKQKDLAGNLSLLTPTSTTISDRREAELSQAGFIPLCYVKNADFAVFFGGESTQLAEKFDSETVTENAKISSRLPYIMATSRFTHYIKVMARDKIGSFMEVEDVEEWLNAWILKYVNANSSTKQELKSKYPLAAARVKVEKIPGEPGAYHAIAWLKPWLQMEALSASLRLVVKIPKQR